MQAHLASILAPSPELEHPQAVHLGIVEAALVLVAVVPGAEAQALSLPATQLAEDVLPVPGHVNTRIEGAHTAQVQRAAWHAHQVCLCETGAQLPDKVVSAG